jgi:hypothetical protein
MTTPETETPRASRHEAKSDADYYDNRTLTRLDIKTQLNVVALDVKTRKCAEPIHWTDAPRDNYASMRRFVMHAAELMVEEIIESVDPTRFSAEAINEAKRCSDLFKDFAECHLSGGRAAMANLFLREIIKIHRPLHVANTGDGPKIDVDQTLRACLNYQTGARK